MRRCGSAIAMAAATLLGACREKGPGYTVGQMPDTTAVSTRPLALRLSDVGPGVQRLEVDVFLDGDVTRERAMATVTRTLDSLRNAYPQATVLRATGFVIDFSAARGERVPLQAVLVAEQLPIGRDTLQVRRPGDVYRTNVNIFGDLPSEAR